MTTEQAIKANGLVLKISELAEQLDVIERFTKREDEYCFVITVTGPNASKENIIPDADIRADIIDIALVSIRGKITRLEQELHSM